MDSKQVKYIVQQITNTYATYNSVDELYEIHIKEIPQDVIEGFGGLMLSQDDELAAETMGPDNPSWHSLKSTLFCFMNSNKESYDQHEFHTRMTAAVMDYLMPKISKMIRERLDEMNEEQGCTTELWMDRNTGTVMEHHISRIQSE